MAQRPRLIGRLSDEEEGSPPQGGVNRREQAVPLVAGKIDRSAEAFRE
ncbi:MAG: hypothetical protein AB1453_07385 [Chloroflexota bacterium]